MCGLQENKQDLAPSVRAQLPSNASTKTFQRDTSCGNCISLGNKTTEKIMETTSNDSKTKWTVIEATVRNLDRGRFVDLASLLKINSN